MIAVFAVNDMVSKRTQLVLFVNIVPLGRHEGVTIRGFAGASAAYFGKSLGELTRDEYLSLVAMIIGPNNFHVKKAPEANSLRVAHIKRLLRALPEITSHFSGLNRVVPFSQVFIRFDGEMLEDFGGNLSASFIAFPVQVGFYLEPAVGCCCSDIVQYRFVAV